MRQVGLRPQRAGGVRVEVERLAAGLTVVHHYGHGGWGVLASPGTAVTAVNLVLQQLGTLPSRKNL